MILKKDDTKRYYVQYTVDGVYTTLTGKTLYCKIAGADRATCTNDADQTTYPGRAYFTFNTANGTGTLGEKVLVWSIAIASTSEDFILKNVSDDMLILKVE